MSVVSAPRPRVISTAHQRLRAGRFGVTVRLAALGVPRAAALGVALGALLVGAFLAEHMRSASLTFDPASGLDALLLTTLPGALALALMNGVVSDPFKSGAWLQVRRISGSTFALPLACVGVRVLVALLLLAAGCGALMIAFPEALSVRFIATAALACVVFAVGAAAADAGLGRRGGVALVVGLIVIDRVFAQAPGGMRLLAVHTHLRRLADVPQQGLWVEAMPELSTPSALMSPALTVALLLALFLWRTHRWQPAAATPT